MDPYLPKGTLVKHGTSSAYLLSILEIGLVPTPVRSKRNKQNEPAHESERSIFVGTLAGYARAIYAFSNTMHATINRKEPPHIPVVLNITLGRDCPLLADEDFIELPDGQTKNGNARPDGYLREQAQAVWSKYESGSIVLDGGMPASWINSFEFPAMFDPTEEASKAQLQKLSSDVHLLSLAYGQNRLKLPISKWHADIKQYKKNDMDISRLTGKFRFKESDVERLFDMPAMQDPNKLFEYTKMVWTLFSQQLVEAGLVRT
ncbi:MAG: hypothetical protein HOH43_22380 [Candidatus Latescibacteria bacterium]|jgi:hypothetical protein|nr:hypothetical protein [Candidatus Latescibacterota bacterium]